MRKNKSHFFFGITGIIVANVIFSIATQTPSSSRVVSPLAQAQTVSIAPTSSPTPSPTPTPESGIPAIVKEEFNALEGTYAIVVKHLKTQEAYLENEHDVFQSASLYKLWVMATVMEKIKDGDLDEDTMLSEDVSALNQAFDIDLQSAQLKEGVIAYPVKEALVQMITISHNYAALLLSKTVRNKNIQVYLTKNGFTESEIKRPPKTTAADTAAFFEKLYNGALVDQAYSQKMIDILKKQKLRNKLPKHLPDTTVIAHKTGELGTYSHDAGIIYHPNGDYIIAVLTDTPNPSKTEEKIARLSKRVYEYFTHSSAPL
jgi:beta-lactamase class A